MKSNGRDFSLRREKRKYFQYVKHNVVSEYQKLNFHYGDSLVRIFYG